MYYHMGQTIYVKTKGMALGNYRYMISLGMPPTEADIEKNYANRNLENQLLINEHICPGAMGELTENDVLVITPSNYETALNDDALGRLVRFDMSAALIPKTSTTTSSTPAVCFLPLASCLI